MSTDAPEPEGYGVPRSDIGGHRVLRLLGRGGFALVFLCVTPDGRDLVAVKVIRPDRDERDVRLRFRREIEVLRAAGQGATVGHPLVRLRGAAPVGESPWLSTDYVPGPSLAQLVEDTRTPLSDEALWWVAGRLIRAVAEVHRRRILHRDISPRNALISVEGLRLIDFGTATRPEDERVTQTGQFIGTPLFAAPEWRTFTGATTYPAGVPGDVYGYGRTLQWLATGGGAVDDGAAPRPGGVLGAVRRRMLAAAGLRGRLQALIDRCVQADPAARPTVAELVALTADGPASLIRIPTDTMVRAFGPRHWALIEHRQRQHLRDLAQINPRTPSCTRKPATPPQPPPAPPRPVPGPVVLPPAGIGAAARSPVLPYGDRLVVATAAGIAHGLDIATGMSVWHHTTSGIRVGAGPDMVLAACAEGRLRALRPGDGEVLWEESAPVGPELPPVVEDGTVYLACGDGTLREFATDTGLPGRTWSIAERLATPPAVTATTAVVVSEDGVIVVLDLRGSRVRRPARLPAPPRVPVLLADDLAIAALPGRLTARSLTDGTVRWEHPVPAPTDDHAAPAAPALAAGLVVTGAADGTVTAVDAATGRQRWQTHVAAPAVAAPAVHGPDLFVACTDGHVHLLDAMTGRSRWSTDIGDPVDHPPTPHRGLLYVATRTGSVHALKPLRQRMTNGQF